MWINDYRFFSQEERRQYLSSQHMLTGIPYFGGKSKIGKYIYNAIFNMAITMQDNGDKPRVFVDAFTGGGKMGLSMPCGWFDTIIMNDLDYGVSSYYRYAKEHHRELLKVIDKLIDNMTEELFFISLKARENRDVEPIVAAAMTYLTAAVSFNNIINYDKASYKPKMGENSEKVELEKIRSRAHRTVQAVNRKLNEQNYIIENLDYRALIRKYNGIDKGSALCDSRSILWYFDPPYYKYCLEGTDAAPYANSFEEDDTIEMTSILSGKDKSCGDLFYFIKSDYNPKETIKDAERALNSSAKLKSKAKKTYENIMKHKEEMATVFDSIETDDYIVFSVGGFDKGAIKSDGSVSVGDEWIWTKGLPTNYKSLEPVRLAEDL